jgi:competence protein ComEA
MWKLLMAVLMSLACALSWAAVDVNKATQAELESVKGIGPAMSGRMLDERKKSAFKDWEDLIGRVKGLGSGNAAKMSGAGLTVNGAAFTAPAQPARPAKAASSTDGKK